MELGKFDGHRADPAATHVRLPVNSGVLECAALKEQLMPLLGLPGEVIIDGAGVQHTDTGALQLLFAFSRDRAASGFVTSWQADSPVLRAVAETLSLNVGLPSPSATPGA